MRPTEKEVGRRLKVTARELGLRTTKALADYLGVERGTCDAWVNGRAFPPVHHLTRLRDEHGITMDWIFFNDLSGLSYARGIRLQAAMEGVDVPPVDPAEPEQVVLEVEKPAGVRRQRKKPRAATS